MLTIAIIGSIISATPTPLVEVQDTVVMVAERFALDIIALNNEVIVGLNVNITYIRGNQCRSVYSLNTYGMETAKNEKQKFNYSCPIRGSPV